MEKGDLVYITPNKGNGKGIIMASEQSYQGDEDMSLHGSPLYEDFIECSDLKTGERKSFGDRDYHWCDPIGKIERLQEALAKIKHIAQFP